MNIPTYTELLRRAERAEQDLRDHVQMDDKLRAAAIKLQQEVRVIVGYRRPEDPHQIDLVHAALEELETVLR